MLCAFSLMRTAHFESEPPHYPSLSYLSDSDLLLRAREISLEERKAGIALLHHLAEIERRRLHAAIFGSLHEYVVRELGYSDGAAHRRISAMRLMKFAPEVEEKLERGTLTLSTASQIQNFLKTEKRVTGVGARCEQTLSNGERCSRTHLLQIDHRFPVAWGGGNELTNLQLLCAVHNQVKSDRLPGE
jgi:hypothetical protein